MSGPRGGLGPVLEGVLEALDEALDSRKKEPGTEEVGVVTEVGHGVAEVEGLPGVRAEELVRFSGGLLGMALNLDPGRVGVVLLGDAADLEAGSEVRRTGRVLDFPVGEALVGRVVDATGRPLDELGPVHAEERWPVERPAPAIMDRAPVTRPLQTGIKVVDALVPVGRGQRELILGDRQTGKTAIALDAVANQIDEEVLCVYCVLGQRSSAVARLISGLREHGALEYTTVVVASGEDAPGLQFVAPYAATTLAERFMEEGRDVLVVYDDLTRHARAYRELSLLLRRPPGREAYPGDVFYLHSRLLERATHLREERGGGSLTALPIIETQAQNISAYIPTNLISITDGQIYLSPQLFRKGMFPAVDVGRSVSRVGGKAQLPAYRAVAGDLRLSYSQYEELEAFARFGTQLDEETRHTLERGRRVREVLKQPRYATLPVHQQIAALLAVTEGLFDDLELDEVVGAERAVREAVAHHLPRLCERIEAGQPLEEEDLAAILDEAGEALEELREGEDADD